MELYLLRHAETEFNKRGAMSSNCADPLSENGLNQAVTIVDELAKLGIQKILCSPYSRAIKTITPFAERFNVTTEIHACLAEGQLVLDSDVEPHTPLYNNDCHPSEDETCSQFIGRAREAAKLIRVQERDRILIVSHGHMLRELLNIFLRTNKKVRFPHDNCGLSSIRFEEYLMINYINRALV